MSELNTVTKVQIDGAVNGSIKLECDYAGAQPIYINWSKDQDEFIYSSDLVHLLEYSRKQGKLEVDRDSLVELLMHGFVRAPKTIYKNLYVLSIGDSLQAKLINNKVSIEFEHEFKFTRENSANEGAVDKNDFLELLYSPISKLLERSPSAFLFHSAGKDSNGIALAIAEAGKAGSVQSMTYAAPGENDESAFVSKLANKLGFSHRVIDLPNEFETRHIHNLEEYFTHITLPCADNAALMYALIGQQIPKDSCVIDGMGNDIYIGHISPATEYRRQRFSSSTKTMGKLCSPFLSTLAKQSLMKSRAHITGFSGFSYYELQHLLPGATDPTLYWETLSDQYRTENYVDFRARVRGVYIDSEKFSRKVRSASDAYSWDVSFPWMDEDVAKYVFNKNESCLFDAKRFKNKLFLRTLLKAEMELDSDALGKKAFSFDYHRLVISLLPFLQSQLSHADYFEKHALLEAFEKLLALSCTNDKNATHWRLRLYRIFVIVTWITHSKYLN